MANQHFILTTLFAYVKNASGVIPEPGEGRPADLKRFLKNRKPLDGVSVQLRPIIVSFKKEEFERGSWHYELDVGDTFLGHGSALYEVVLDPKRESINNVVDSIHAARVVVEKFVHENIDAIRIDPKIVPKSRCLLVSQLTEFYERQGRSTALRYDFEDAFSVRSGTSGRNDRRTWKLVPVFMRDLRLQYAALFLRASFREFLFLGDEIEDAILSNESPSQVLDAVRAENAVHNAYKVIEAVWGGNLPESQSKIERGLELLGVDPNTMVGYAHHGIHPKVPIINKVLELRKARNEKAAHGRIHADRKSTYYEILDFQALARAILQMHIAFKYPDAVS